MLFQLTPYPSTVGGTFQSLMQALIDWGFIDAFLPFMLIFVLIFATLQKTKLFGEGADFDTRKPDRQINGVLAFVIAAMVVVPHIAGLYPPDSDPIIIINTFLPSTAVILIAVLCVILLLGLAGTEVPNVLLWSIALVAAGFLIFMILVAVLPGFLPTFDFLRDPAIQALIIILLVMGLIGYFVVREPAATATAEGGWEKFIKSMFKKV